MKLYIHQPPAPPDSMYIGQAQQWKRRGKIALRCYVDGDNAYCLDDPRLVNAVITEGVPIEIINVRGTTYAEWSDPVRYRREKLDKLVRRAFGNPERPRGNAYEISDKKENGKVYCIGIRQISGSTIIL